MDFLVESFWGFWVLSRIFKVDFWLNLVFGFSSFLRVLKTWSEDFQNPHLLANTGEHVFQGPQILIWGQNSEKWISPHVFRFLEIFRSQIPIFGIQEGWTSRHPNQKMGVNLDFSQKSQSGFETQSRFLFNFWHPNRILDDFQQNSSDWIALCRVALPKSLAGKGFWGPRLSDFSGRKAFWRQNIDAEVDFYVRRSWKFTYSDVIFGTGHILSRKMKCFWGLHWLRSISLLSSNMCSPDFVSKVDIFWFSS